MIWQAGPDEIVDLVGMGERFVASLGEPYRIEDLSDYMREVMASGVILRTDAGMIGGVMTRLPFQRDRKVATELFWWSEDRQGRQLLNAFEEWAKSNGAELIILSAIGKRSRAGKMLERFGYEVCERAYRKAS